MTSEDVPPGVGPDPSVTPASTPAPANEAAGSRPPGTPGGEGTVVVAIEDEMRRSYLDYAMSVIVARALPDVRDGLKPVHRRILFAMKEGGYEYGKPFKKSARAVGDVMGKYHPHGDSAIYDALVRLAQDFSVRVPLIEGQGNFGSLDNDPPAAMRYTEARLAKAGEALQADIDEDTVDFQDNYDGADQEPKVLPARFPNLLVNGAGGIAVGMATNIPTHNLGEVIDGCLLLLDDPAADLNRLLEVIPGPDFPTGAIIVGRGGIRQAYATGHGSILLRARSSIETIRKDRDAIIVHDVPYQVNKARMIERIAEAVHDKIIEGISDVRDESDRDGVRVVIELKRDADANVTLNQLYRHTPLQTSFGINMLAIQGGIPRTFTLKHALEAFLDFRQEVVTRRTRYRLRKARERGHVLVGLAVAVANIDEVIHLIRTAPDPQAAREALTARAWPVESVAALVRLLDEPGRAMSEEGTYYLSEEQARAILDLRLQRLTGLEREKIEGELSEVAAQIADLLETLATRSKLLGIVRTELIEARDEFATPRRTTIEDSSGDVEDEDLIQREDMVVTVSHAGYVKRVPIGLYRAQRRGGRGRTGMTTREEDVVTDVFVANTHQPVLFFSTRGLVYRLKVWKLPVGAPAARGKAFVNLLPLQPGETISTVMALPEDEATWGSLDILFSTAAGDVRRNKLSDFANIRQGGLIAMKLSETDRLIGVALATPDDDVLLATRFGRAIRFPVDDVRVFQGRTSTGVRGIRLAEGDEVISMTILRGVQATADEREAFLRVSRSLRREGLAAEDGEGDGLPIGGEDAAESELEPETASPEGEGGEAGRLILAPERLVELTAQEQFILVATERGYGKRTSAYEYRLTGRGGLGIASLRPTERSGSIVATTTVAANDELMLVSDAGQMLRIPVEGISFQSRNGRGVTLFRVDPDEKVVAVAPIRDAAAGDKTAEAEAEDESDETDEGAPGAAPSADAAGNET